MNKSTLPIRTRDQQRSEWVFEHVERISRNDTAKKEYKTLALSFPTMVRSCGLIQTIGFYMAKGKKAKDKKKENQHDVFLQHIQDELIKLGFLQASEDLFSTAQSSSLEEYIQLTREVIGLGQWHKRFSQALIADSNVGGES
jgi:CRISPR-associated protein Cmr5